MRTALRTLIICTFLAPSAHAQETETTTINGLQIEFEGVEFDLNSNFGTRLSDDRWINLSDCYDYLDLTPEGSCTEEASTDTTDGETTDNADAAAPGKADHGGDTSEHLLKLTLSTSGQATSGAFYDFLAVYVGSGCPASTLPDGSQDDCEQIYEDSQTLWTNIDDIEIPLSLLLGDSCDSEPNVDIMVYVRDEQDIVDFEQIEITFDYASPDTPAINAVVEGEENLKVTWDEAAASGDLTYNVYYSTTGFTTADIEAGTDNVVKAKGGINTSDREYSITNLINGQEYWIAVTSVDEAGNESIFCDQEGLRTGTPLLVDDFWEQYKGQGGQEVGGNFQCTASPSSQAGPGALALGLLVLLALWRPRRMTRAVAPVLAATALLAASPASAQLFGDVSAESPRSHQLEVKFGSWTPDIDSEGTTAYQQAFDGEGMFTFRVQYDYQFWKDFGSLAIGFETGYGSVTGHGQEADGTSTTQSTDTTRLQMVPLTVSLVYSLDVLATRWNIPLVPTFKLGLDWMFWWIEDGVGDTAQFDETTSTGRTRFTGSGDTTGWHATVGIKLLLDTLAPSMAQTFDIEVGVNNTYLFAELVYADISDFGSSTSWQVGDLTGFFGLAFEF